MDERSVGIEGYDIVLVSHASVGLCCKKMLNLLYWNKKLTKNRIDLIEKP